MRRHRQRLPDRAFHALPEQRRRYVLFLGHAGASQLPAEIVWIATSTKKCEIWVTATLSVSADVTVYVWYKARRHADAACGDRELRPEIPCWSARSAAGVLGTAAAPPPWQSPTGRLSTSTNNGATAGTGKIGGEFPGRLQPVRRYGTAGGFGDRRFYAVKCGSTPAPSTVRWCPFPTRIIPAAGTGSTRNLTGLVVQTASIWCSTTATPDASSTRSPPAPGRKSLGPGQRNGLLLPERCVRPIGVEHGEHHPGAGYPDRKKPGQHLSPQLGRLDRRGAADPLGQGQPPRHGLRDPDRHVAGHGGSPGSVAISASVAIVPAVVESVYRVAGAATSATVAGPRRRWWRPSAA